MLKSDKGLNENKFRLHEASKRPKRGILHTQSGSVPVIVASCDRRKERKKVSNLHKKTRHYES